MSGKVCNSQGASLADLGASALPVLKGGRVHSRGPALEVRGDSVLSLFDRTVQAVASDAIAVKGKDRALTYRGLDDESKRLAGYLQHHGVHAGDVVGIYLSRTPDLLVAILALWRVGAAYLPLDPEFPEERLKFMVEDASVSAILCESRPATAWLGAESIIDIAGERPEWMASQPLDGTGEAKGATAAYVLYTSGSTGKPNGVVVPHRAVVNLLQSMSVEPGIRSDDRVLAVTTVSFDISVLELFLPLTVGATTVLATPEQAGDGRQLREHLESERISVMQATPSTWRLLIDAGWEGSPGFKGLCGGEAFPRDLRGPMIERCGEVWNLYGPTETTVWSACAKLKDEGPITVGKPIANTDIFVLDQLGHALPPGVPGEVWIGGAGVSLGYLNRPDLTAERFKPYPHDTNTGRRMYRTGDIGRWTEDGELEIMGRLDQQVKIRGFRIELPEIEACLAEHPDVRNAVVTVWDPRPDDRRLVAYVVIRSSDLSTVALRKQLRAFLPAYMIPQHFVRLDELPLTPNGKIDRKALRPPERQRAQEGPPPKDSLERFMAKEWETLLGLESIPRNVAFFELGGTSLTAARFVNRMQEALGEFIYVVSIFDAPTIEEYGALLKREYGAAVASRFPDVRVVDVPWKSSAAVDASAVVRFERCVPLLAELETDPASPKNKPAIFILAPPRSGTTLLRVMLAGSPKLFAAAELQLLGFDTLRDREHAFRGKHALWLEGTIRAIMELKQCDADTAKAFMADMVSQGLSTGACFRVLQGLAAPRMLVDKSPSYALDPSVLAKAESDFEQPLYIHLRRHPLSVIGSFVDYHMNQVLYLKPHAFTADELAEHVWTVSHRNILRFLETVPEERQHQISFENLVKEPGREVVRLCDRLGLGFVPEMTRPYDDIESKMTDGIYADSTPMGDTRFLERASIDPTVGERWREVKLGHPLGALTKEIARRLSYEIGDESDDLVLRRSRARSRRREARRQNRVAD